MCACSTFIYPEVFPITQRDLLMNEDIRFKEVRLVDENGEQLGIVSGAQALAMAEERQKDLVCIAPQGKPPVCKIMDYGKFQFEQSKRVRDARKNQKTVAIKEVRLSATIDSHDLEVKAKAAYKFLKAGDKVKATIRFRGRQVTHSDLGARVMMELYDRVEEVATIERKPKVDGRNMIMVLAPRNTEK